MNTLENKTAYLTHYSNCLNTISKRGIDRERSRSLALILIEAIAQSYDLDEMKLQKDIENQSVNMHSPAEELNLLKDIASTFKTVTELIEEGATPLYAVMKVASTNN